MKHQNEDQCNQLVVANIIHTLVGGGAQTQVRRLAEYWSHNRAYSVVHVVDGRLHCAANSLDGIAGKVVEISNLPATKLIERIRQFRCLFRENGVDVVVAWLPEYHILPAILAARLEKIPTITTLRRRGLPVTSVIGLRDRALIVGAWCSKHIVTNFDMPRSERMVVTLAGCRPWTKISNLVDSAWGKPPEAPGSARLTGRQPLWVVVVGRLTKWKRPEEAIHLADALSNAGHNIAGVRFFGDGPCSSRLRESAKKMKISVQIGWSETDWRGNLPSNNCVVVHSSEAEGTSNAILEAIGANLPTFIYDTPQNRDASLGVEEILYSNIEELVGKVCGVIASESHRADHVAAQQKIIESWDNEEIMEKWASVINSARQNGTRDGSRVT